MTIPYSTETEARADLARELNLDEDFANELGDEELLERFYQKFSPKRVFDGGAPKNYTNSLLNKCYDAAGKTTKTEDAPTPQNFAGFRELVIKERLEN